MRALHKVRAAGAVAALAASLLVVLPGSAAHAHGSNTFPLSRTYACFVDGLAGGNGGDLNPTNPACAAAWRNGPNYPFWNWFGNLISNAGGRHREIIPDGNLCGPDPQFAQFRAAREDWPTTALQPGQPITMRFNAWAPHPGTWSTFVTRDGWNPNQPLRWADLEATPFNEVTNPPLNGSGPHGAEWTWPATAPAGKSGRHIFYTIWQRSDSPEAFYNCSDVWIGEGAPPPPPPPPPPPSADCDVQYVPGTTWGDGFTAEIRVTNTGDTPVFGWTVRWSFPSGQRVTQGWNADIRQNGADVTAINMSWNLRINPGQTVSFGLNGSHTGTNDPPTDIEACTTPGAPAGPTAQRAPFISVFSKVGQVLARMLAQWHQHGHHG